MAPRTGRRVGSQKAAAAARVLGRRGEPSLSSSALSSFISACVEVMQIHTRKLSEFPLLSVRRL